MTVSLDNLRLAAEFGGGRLDRHDAQARQDRWMQQLERAAFAELSKPAPAPAGAPAALVHARTEPLAGAPAMLAPAQAPAAQAQGPHAAAAVAEPHGRAGERAAARRGTPAAAEDGAAAASSARADTPVQAATAELRAAEADLAGALAAAPNLPAGAAPAPLAATIGSAGGGAVAAPGATARVMAADGAAAPAASAPAGRSSLVSGFGLASALPPPRLLAGGNEAAEPASHAPPVRAQEEPYAKNLLHLYHGEEGVHAFLRDAALSQVQARAVAEAMASQLAGSGNVLAALTVNGKRVPVGSAGAGDDSADGTADGAHTPTPAGARRAGPDAVQGAT